MDTNTNSTQQRADYLLQSAYSTMEKEALHLFRAMTPEQRTQVLVWVKNRSSKG